jgi:hypothetical protein
MAIARSNVILMGTDESTLQSIANNATQNGSETDILADDTSTGYAHVYLVITSTSTSGSIDLELHPYRVTGQVYPDQPPYRYSYPPTNGTQQIFVGTIQLSRRMRARVKNNATGASASVLVALEVFKMT